MHPYLRQALMRHHGEFFAMTDEEQTLFKLQDHEKLDKKMRIFIEDKLGIPHGKRKASYEQIFEYNKINLPYIGIGPNSFMLNEWHWDEKILRFKNLYEANEHNHDFQEQGMVDDFDKDYVKKPLYNRVNDWARAFVDDEFYYLNLCSYSIWLFYDMEEISYDWLEENIPYKYVSGKDDGKKTKGGYLWDKVLDAKGLEGWHDHMRRFAHDWINDHYDVDITIENRFDDCVYVIDGEGIIPDDPTDPNLVYIFSSLEILREITYYDFVNDCEKVKGNPTELLALRKSRRAEFKTTLEEEFARIKKSQPPGLIEHKKTSNNVVIAEGALDGLEE